MSSSLTNPSLSKDLLLSAQIHKKVRQYIKDELLKPYNSFKPLEWSSDNPGGRTHACEIKLIDLAKSIESYIAKLTNYNPTNPMAGGVAFPTGLSINNCAAHWTPNPSDTYQTLKHNDLIKIDWGVHVNGAITDGAFSFSFNNDRYLPLIQASEEATKTAIDMAGVDAYIGDIGVSIQEVIESYEIELDGTTHKLKSIGDLCGHQIGKYQIHCGKSVPNIRFPPLMTQPLREKYRMKEGEVYAIETFPTTGSGMVSESSDPHECSHYMANYTDIKKYNKAIVSKSQQSRRIDKMFGTLAFCKRWCPRETFENDEFNRNVKKGIYTAYPPLYSEPNTYVAQTEHTIYISSAGAIKLN